MICDVRRATCDVRLCDLGFLMEEMFGLFRTVLDWLGLDIGYRISGLPSDSGWDGG